jgi:predicted DNA-binding transcriptional regulator YafY
VLKILAEAAIYRQVVEFDYFSPHKREQTHRRAGILLLHNFIGDWFAVSFDQEKLETRDFHAGRMKNLKLLNREAVLPKIFNAEEYLQQGFFMMKGGKPTEISIHFDDYQAQWIRERGAFHPAETREDLPDGSLRLTFEIGEMGLEAVARFCLTYAGHCRVEKPEKLKEIIRKKLQKGLILHQ